MCLLARVFVVNIVHAQDAEIYVNPPLTMLPYNSNFTVTVEITNVTNLYGLEIQLEWNKSRIEYINHTVHTPVESYMDGVLHEPVLKVIDAVEEDDTYRLAYYSLVPAPSFNGSGVIFDMSFHCKSSGICTLDLTIATPYDTMGLPIACQVKGGFVIVGGVSEFIVVGDKIDSKLDLWLYPWIGERFAPGTLVDKFNNAPVSDLEIFDADNDCDLDFLVVIGRQDDIKLYLYVNEGDGTFKRRNISNTVKPTGTDWAHVDICVGYFTRDGKMDFIVTSGGDRITKIYLFINLGDLSFEQQDPLEATWATHAWGIDTADFNEDKECDFVMFDYPDETDFQDDVYIYFGDGSGGFTEQFVFQTPHSVSHVTAEDFDNDGHFDILIGKDDDGDPGQTWFCKGNGDGAFQAATESFDLDQVHETGAIDYDEGAGGMDAYDADTDGYRDVISCASGRGSVYFLKGDGTGTNFEETLIDDTLTNPITVAAMRRIDVAVTSLVLSFPPMPPLRTVDENIWVADFPEYVWGETTTGGGTPAAYDGDGNPHWTGSINHVLSYSSVDSVNSIHAYFLGNNTDRDLIGGVDEEYRVHPDGTVELLVSLDVPIYNEYYVMGVNATPPGWPALQHNCSGIQSVYVKFPNGTERWARNLGYQLGPPNEWWYEPDWPYELESWWATGYYPGPWTWPDDTEYWVNYTAASKITVDYNVKRTRLGPFLELGESLDIYVTVENQGGFTETFEVSLYYLTNWRSPTGPTVTLIGTQTLALGSQASTTLAFAFTPSEYGSYKILAEAVVPCEQDPDDDSLEDRVYCPDPSVWLSAGSGTNLHPNTLLSCLR